MSCMPAAGALRPLFLPPKLLSAVPAARFDEGRPVDADRLSWEQHATTIDAVPSRLSTRVNVDLIWLSSMALVMAPRAEPYRERLRSLSGFEMSWLDELPSLARAVRYLGEMRKLDPENVKVGGLVRQATELRRRLAQIILAKRAFAGTPTRHAIPPQTARSPAAHATALYATVLSLRALGLSQTPVSEEDLAAAEALVLAIMKVGDPPARVPEIVKEGRIARGKALVLLAAVYGEVRAAVLYVGRHEPNIDRVFPALWSLRKNPNARRRRARKLAAAQPIATSDPGEPNDGPAEPTSAREE